MNSQNWLWNVNFGPCHSVFLPIMGHGGLKLVKGWQGEKLGKKKNKQ
jgi:hypothetical protein